MMQSYGRVLILLSTYNGEKYIRELLDSIYRQTYSDFCLYIRDDGSKDNTKLILEEYKNKYRNIIDIVYGKNIGAKGSFFELLKKADNSFDYYAFADQDDVWLDNKLEKAMEKLWRTGSRFSMYCSPTILVDSSLQVLKENTIDTHNHSFGNALIENIACGCTMVFSHDILTLIQKNGIPQHMYMHDWLIYMLAEAYGEVILDEKGYILYRQHENNTVGNALNSFQHFKRRIKNSKNQKQYVMLQADELKSIYNLPESANKLVNIISSRTMINRIRMLFNNEIKRSSFKDTIIFKIFWFL